MTKQDSLHIRFASLNPMGTEVSSVPSNTCTYTILATNCTLETQIFETFFAPFILQNTSC